MTAVCDGAARSVGTSEGFQQSSRGAPALERTNADDSYCWKMSDPRYPMRQAGADDAENLIVFGKAEFTRTFGHLYTDQDLQTYLSEGYNPILYQKWLTDDQYRIFVATSPENEQKIIGYVLCGPCTLPLENCGYEKDQISSCREIKRLYIHPDYFGSQLSLLLLQSALQWLVKEGFSDKIFLGVYSENPRAMRFYSKHGFERVGEYGFVVGDTVDREFIFHWTG